MVLVRAYALLDEVVVEITCWHGEGEASHLLLREHVRVEELENLGEVLAKVAEVVSFAATLTCEGSTYADPRCLAVL